ncbi:uncharacterized protein [Amphiura filiformis]|uniref:uncharacterized protein n=1 Tax=Amphiura filiformis TaxID=82378 RepID=UPI003B20C761
MMRLHIPRIRNVFLCVVISALVASIIFMFNVSSTSVSNRAKRKHIEVKSHDMKSYQQQLTSWKSTPDDNEEGEKTHESFDAEDANALANVFANIRGVKKDAMYHGNNSNEGSDVSKIKGFPDIVPQKELDLNSTGGLNIDQAIRNYNERVKQNISQTTLAQFVIVTTVDFQFHHLFDNWLASVKKLGLRYNIMLICEDNEAYKYYSLRQNNHFKVLNTLDYQMYGKLQRKKGTYQQLIKRRTMYVRNLLFAGIDVLLVDIDAVWLKDPLQVVRQSYSIYDIWVAQGYDPGVPCPCFLYMKSVPSIMKVAGAWMHRLADNNKKNTSRF